MHEAFRRLLTWTQRTPVQTFLLFPLAVIAFELLLHAGRLTFAPWGLWLLGWGYLQYLLVGRYRHPRAGGSAGMTVAPDRIITNGPYRYTRNPMYLGHLIFMLGVAVTFWSWFAVILLVLRALWFHHRVLHDEARLSAKFGEKYDSYRARVKRWIPGMI